MFTPRRILFFISSVGGGGAERVATTLCNAWAERGDSVTLVATYSGRVPNSYKISSRVQLAHLADVVGSSDRGLRSYWRRFWALRGMIRRSNPDVVVSFLVTGNVAVLLASLGLGYRVVVSERTYPPSFRVKRFIAFLRRITYPRAACVVMQTSPGLRWLQSRIPRAVGAVIPNPISYPLNATEPTIHPEAILAPQAKLLLAAGRLDQGKQFDVLLHCFAKLARKHTEWVLVVLGEGPERARLEAQVTELCLGNRVVLPGRAGNMGDWYERADLFVSTSRYEGFPNTIMEALAYGCAVASYDCATGPAELIQHEVNGLLVAPVGDEAAMTEALDRLISNEAERGAMAARAIEVRHRYSVNAVLEMWDEVISAGDRLAKLQ